MKVDMSFDDLPTLEEGCDGCNGSGVLDDLYGDSVRCENCSGSGIIPSEFGKAILEFVRKYKDFKME